MSDKSLKQSIDQIGEAVRLLENKIKTAKNNPMLSSGIYLKILMKRAKKFVGLSSI
jgi:hypothetical protein